MTKQETTEKILKDAINSLGRAVDALNDIKRQALDAAIENHDDIGRRLAMLNVSTSAKISHGLFDAEYDSIVARSDENE